MKTVIALYSPYPGAGKTTVAEEFMKMGVQRVKFAGCLKEMLAALFRYQGANEEEIYRLIEGDLKENPSAYLCGQSSRFGQRTLGTEWGRDIIGESIWLNALKFRVKQIFKTDDVVLIDDLRFENEYYFLDSVFPSPDFRVCMVRIIRPSVAVEAAHRSDGGLEQMEFDINLNNANMNVEEFAAKAKRLICAVTNLTPEELKNGS